LPNSQLPTSNRPIDACVAAVSCDSSVQAGRAASARSPVALMTESCTPSIEQFLFCIFPLRRGILSRTCSEAACAILSVPAGTSLVLYVSSSARPVVEPSAWKLAKFQLGPLAHWHRARGWAMWRNQRQSQLLSNTRYDPTLLHPSSSVAGLETWRKLHRVGPKVLLDWARHPPPSVTHP